MFGALYLQVMISIFANAILSIYPLLVLFFFVCVLNHNEEKEPIFPEKWVWLLKLNLYAFIGIFFVILITQNYYQSGYELGSITYDQVKEISGNKLLYFIGFIILYRLKLFANVLPKKKI